MSALCSELVLRSGGNDDTLAECVLVFLIHQLVFVFSFVCSPQKLQAGCCTIVWALWQCTRIWTYYFQPSSTFEQVCCICIVVLWNMVCCGTPEQGKVLQKPTWKGGIYPKASASYELHGHFWGTGHNWLAPKSYLAVVKEHIEDMRMRLCTDWETASCSYLGQLES